jgi:release factor glutamine methyltransferase
LALNIVPPVYLLAVTVLEVIQRSTEFLIRKKVESPRLQAELLLAHVLALPRMQLYLNFERTLTATEQDTLRTLVVRRGEREPLQHILGSTSFCGLEISVNRHVLIPRPETELLAEQGWIFLQQRAAAAVAETAPGLEADSAPAALDFGTGSGCIAIALAVHCPTAGIVAVDIDEDALTVARTNAARHGVADRIRFLEGDRLAGVEPQPTFDLIVSNPPYIPRQEIEHLEPEVREHDPRRALDGGPDGLDFYRYLARHTSRLLRSGGRVLLEFGDGQENALRELFEAEKWIVEQIMKDYSQTPRILFARRPD